MPPFEEEEPFEDARRAGKGGGGAGSWDLEEQQERTPDDMATVRCSSCRKWILEDAPQCPYCRHWQSDEAAYRRPWWFWAALIFCLLVMGGFSVIALLGMLPWRFP